MTDTTIIYFVDSGISSNTLPQFTDSFGYCGTFTHAVVEVTPTPTTIPYNYASFPTLTINTNLRSLVA